MSQCYAPLTLIPLWMHAHWLDAAYAWQLLHRWYQHISSPCSTKSFAGNFQPQDPVLLKQLWRLVQPWALCDHISDPLPSLGHAQKTRETARCWGVKQSARAAVNETIRQTQFDVTAATVSKTWKLTKTSPSHFGVWHSKNTNRICRLCRFWNLFCPMRLCIGSWQRQDVPHCFMGYFITYQFQPEIWHQHGKCTSGAIVRMSQAGQA